MSGRSASSSFMTAPRSRKRQSVVPRRIGVLLINLGTPDATDYWSMRRYLREFLSDPRVIEQNRIVWWFILKFIILSVRPRVRGRAYAAIWNRDKHESP